MAKRLEKKLQVERAAKSPLERIGGAVGRRESVETRIASGLQDRANAGHHDDGFGAGFLEEQRRSRAWMLALGGIIAVVVIRMILRSF